MKSPEDSKQTLQVPFDTTEPVLQRRLVSVNWYLELYINPTIDTVEELPPYKSELKKSETANDVAVSDNWQDFANGPVRNGGICSNNARARTTIVVIGAAQLDDCLALVAHELCHMVDLIDEHLAINSHEWRAQLLGNLVGDFVAAITQ